MAEKQDKNAATAVPEAPAPAKKAKNRRYEVQVRL